MTFYSEVCTLEGSDRTLSVWVRAVLNLTAELYKFINPVVKPYCNTMFIGYTFVSLDRKLPIQMSSLFM